MEKYYVVESKNELTKGGIVDFLSKMFAVKVKGDGVDINDGAGMYQSEGKRNVYIFATKFDADRLAGFVNGSFGSGIWQFVDTREIVLGEEELPVAPSVVKKVAKPVSKETIIPDDADEEDLDGLLPEVHEEDLKGASTPSFDGTSEADIATATPARATGVVSKAKVIAKPITAQPKKEPIKSPSKTIAKPVGATSAPNPNQRPRSVLQPIGERKGRL